MKEEEMPLIMKHIVWLKIAWQWRYFTDKPGFLFSGAHGTSSWKLLGKPYDFVNSLHNVQGWIQCSLLGEGALGICVRYVGSPFHPSFVYRHKPFKKCHTLEFSFQSLVWVSFLSNLDGRDLIYDDIPYKNPYCLWLLNQIRSGFRWDADN